MPRSGHVAWTMGDDDPRIFIQGGAGRGVHSSTFQLNLSRK